MTAEGVLWYYLLAAMRKCALRAQSRKARWKSTSCATVKMARTRTGPGRDGLVAVKGEERRNESELNVSEGKEAKKQNPH